MGAMIALSIYGYKKSKPFFSSIYFLENSIYNIFKFSKHMFFPLQYVYNYQSKRTYNIFVSTLQVNPKKILHKGENRKKNTFFAFPPSVKPSLAKRSSMILPQHVGGVFFVHNGKINISVHISPKMLGHKFGEFASTRKKPHHKKKK